MSIPNASKLVGGGAEPSRFSTGGTTPSLPPRVLRSRLPGFLLAAGAVLALGGFISWKVVGQANAIHRAEVATPAEEQGAVVPTGASASGAPSPVLVMLPSDPNAAVSRTTTTTGASVAAPTAPNATPPSGAVPVAAAPPAAPAKPSMGSTTALSLPVSPLPPVTGTVAAPAAPAPRAHVARPSRATTADDDDNPYADGTAKPAAKAKPSSTATTDDVFAPRQ